MTWDAFVSVVVAILTFGLSLVWPADELPAPGPIVRSQVEAPRGTLHTTTFGRLPEERAHVLREVLTNGVADCWRSPAPDQDPVRVRIQVQLDRAGRVLSTKARVPDSRGDIVETTSLIAAAEKAVMDCQPYDLPAAAGDDWTTININFEPDTAPPSAQ
jgi:hypothetical protein